MPGERDVSVGDITGAIGTEFGILGGRIGVGYGVAGFRPEVSVGYRSATVDSLTVGSLPVSVAAEGTLTSIDLAANVYYDIGSGSDSPSTLESAEDCRW